MNIHNDILLEIWIQSDLITKRKLALASKYLSNHTFISEYLKSVNIELTTQENSHEKLQDVTFAGRYIGRLITNEQRTFVILYTHGYQQSSNIINWLSKTNIVYSILKGRIKFTISSQTPYKKSFLRKLYLKSLVNHELNNLNHGKNYIL